MTDRTTWSRAAALPIVIALLGGCDESNTAPEEPPRESLEAFLGLLRGVNPVFEVNLREIPDAVEVLPDGTVLVYKDGWIFPVESASDSVRWGHLLPTRDEARVAGPPPVIDLPPAEATLEGRDFSRVLSVVELEDGRVLATDQIENSIYVVDFQSGDVRTEGSSGEGPGEYGRVGHLYPLGGDSTLLAGEPPRLLLLAGDRIVRGVDPVYPRLGLGGTGAAPWGIDRSGRVLGVEGFAFQLAAGWEQVEADSLHILLSTGSVFDAGSSEPDTVARVGGQGRLGAERIATRVEINGEIGTMHSTRTSPLASEGQAWLFPDAWAALAHPDPYRVDWLTPAGEWMRGDPLPVSLADATREEQCFAISRWNPDSECDPDAYPGWPEKVPPFVMVVDDGWVTPGGTALRPGPHGLLLIRRTPTTEAPHTRYDVVDRSGALRGAILMPEGGTIVGFGRESLYVVQKDEMDLLTLSRHPWPVQFGSDRGGS